MFGDLKPALSMLVFSYREYMANFKPKRTAAASRGFLAAARLSCSNWAWCNIKIGYFS